LENGIQVEDVNANLEGQKVKGWNMEWMGRWKRRRWYVACIMVTLIVVGVVGGFVGYGLTRKSNTTD
jgi:hypothetical protein